MEKAQLPLIAELSLADTKDSTPNPAKEFVGAAGPDRVCRHWGAEIMSTPNLDLLFSALDNALDNALQNGRICGAEARATANELHDVIQWAKRILAEAAGEIGAQI